MTFSPVAPGITITPASITVIEGGAVVSVNVSLTVAPASPVTVTLSGAGLSQLTVLPATLTFTPAIWSNLSVNVTANADAIAQGNRPVNFTFTATIGDPVYIGKSTPLTVNIVDVPPSSPGGPVITGSEGGYAGGHGPAFAIGSGEGAFGFGRSLDRSPNSSLFGPFSLRDGKPTPYNGTALPSNTLLIVTSAPPSGLPTTPASNGGLVVFAVLSGLVVVAMGGYKLLSSAK